MVQGRRSVRGTFFLLREEEGICARERGVEWIDERTCNVYEREGTGDVEGKDARRLE